MTSTDAERELADIAPTIPAWKRTTAGESRWTVILAVVVAVALQVVLPGRFAPGHRAVPLLELALVIGLWVAHPQKTGHATTWMRPASLTLIGLITITNACQRSG